MTYTKTKTFSTSNSILVKVPVWQNILLRGGRLTKIAGQAVSLSPAFGRTLEVASISALSLGASLTFGAAAQAGTCTIDLTGTWVCSGAADPNDVPVVIDNIFSAPGSVPLSATTFAGFGLTTALGSGIELFNFASSNGLVFSDSFASSISGQANGIHALNDNSNALSITSTGDVIGLSGDGVYAENHFGTDLVIDAHNVSGGSHGIRAFNIGTGTLSITSTGDVIGLSGDGVNAENHFDSADLTLNVVNVTGNNSGINAINVGEGALSITSTGDVIGLSGDGVNAVNDFDSADLTLNVVNVTGNNSGINAINVGEGALSITSTGDITGAGAYGVYTDARGNDISIDVVDVAGGSGGILIESSAENGRTSITVDGTVSSDLGSGISINAGAASETTINLNSSADVSGGDGRAIYLNGGNSTVTVESGAIVQGSIELGRGTDILTFAGSDVSNITILDGGSGATSIVSPSTGFLTSVASTTSHDVLTFARGSTGTLSANSVLNWEEVVLEAGADVGFSGGVLSVSELEIASSSVLNTVADGPSTVSFLVASGLSAGNAQIRSFILDGSLINNGTLSAQNNEAGDVTTITGDYSGDAKLRIDVDFGTNTSDKVVVEGDITGGTTAVIINDVTKGNATGEDVVVAQISGETAEGDFVLASGAIISGAYTYDLSLAGQQWLLLGVENSTGVAYEGFAQSLIGFTDLSTLQQRSNARQKFGSQTDLTGAWVFIGGSTSDGTLTSTSNTAYDTNFFSSQVGYDFQSDLGKNGTWIFGLNGQYSRSTTDLLFDAGDASLSSDGYGLGATATWLGDNGRYVDLQGQMVTVDSDISSSTAGSLATDHETTAYSLSAEVGQSFALSETTSLIPQAQISFASLDVDDLKDSVGNTVVFDTSSSVTLRAGIAHELNTSSALNAKPGSKAYVIGNLLHVSSDANEVDVSGDILSAEADGNWFEVGAGGSVEWDEAKSLFAQVNYTTGLDNDNSGNDNFELSAGMQINW